MSVLRQIALGFILTLVGSGSLWAQGQLVPNFEHDGTITCMIRLTPIKSLGENNLLLTGDESGIIKIRDLEKQQIIYSKKIHNSAVIHAIQGSYMAKDLVVIKCSGTDTFTVLNLRYDRVERIAASGKTEFLIPNALGDGFWAIKATGRELVEIGKKSTEKVKYSRKAESGFKFYLDDLQFNEAILNDHLVSVYSHKKLEHTFETDDRLIRGDMSPNGLFFAAISTTKGHFWNLRSGKHIDFDLPDTSVHIVNFTDDDKFLFIGNLVLDIDSQAFLPMAIYDAEIGFGYTNVEGNPVLIAQMANSSGTRLVKVAGENSYNRSTIATQNAVIRFMNVCDANRLLAVTTVSDVRIIDPERAEVIRVIKPPFGFPSAAAFDHSGSTLLVAVDRSIFVYDGKTFSLLDTLTYPRPGSQWPDISSLTFNRTDSFFVASLSDLKEKETSYPSTWVWQKTGNGWQCVDSIDRVDVWFTEVFESRRNTFLGVFDDGWVEIGPTASSYYIQHEADRFKGSKHTSYPSYDWIISALPNSSIVYSYTNGSHVFTIKEAFPGTPDYVTTGANTVWGLSTQGNDQWLWAFNMSTRHVKWKKKLNKKAVSLSYDKSGQFILVQYKNGVIEWFSADKGVLEVSLLLPKMGEEYLFELPSGEFKSSKLATRFVTYRNKAVTQNLINYELLNHRPDRVLQALKSSDQERVKAYAQSVEKRILRERKRGWQDTSALAPKVTIRVADLIENEQHGPDSLAFFLIVQTEGMALPTVHIWNKGTPVFGLNGYQPDEWNYQAGREIYVRIPLLSGMNELELAIEDQGGRISQRVVYNAFSDHYQKPALYLITIGVSEYADSSWNLKYAAKDATDVSSKLGGGIVDSQHLWGQRLDDYHEYSKVHALHVQDTQVTRSILNEMGDFLKSAAYDDRLILFYAGHGLIVDYDYFLTTHFTDFNQPQDGSISYSELEELLFNAPMNRKLVLLDACHSGELDPELMKGDWVTPESSNLVLYENPTRGGRSATSLTQTNSFLLMKELFGDVSNRTGATVFSSASGTGFAMESDRWNNGVFTYSFLNALENESADYNDDEKLTVHEIIRYVSNEVRDQTNGVQTPDCRMLNIQQDWRIW